MTTPARKTNDAQLADRDWFEAHPGERIRIRPFIHGEDYGISDYEARWTFVQALAPGIRVKTFLEHHPMQSLIPHARR